MGRFVGKVALLSVIVGGLQGLIGNAAAEREFTTRELLDRHLERGVESIYFGDSVLRWVAGQDKDRRSISELLEEKLEPEAVGLVNHDAYHAEIYLAHVEYLLHSPKKPKRVIVPINPRTFCPESDLRPAYQFEVDALRLRVGDPVAFSILRPLTAFKGWSLSPVSESEYREQPVFRGSRPEGRLRDYMDSPQDLGRLFALRWLHPIAPGHRKLRALARIAELCRGSGVGVVFYVSPVDVESGERLAGSDFRPGLARNVGVILSELKAAGVEVLDLSASLGAGDFDWKDIRQPNEHLNERGRKAVAERLADFIRPPRK